MYFWLIWKELWAVCFLFFKTVIENNFQKHREQCFGVFWKLLLLFEFSVFYVLFDFLNQKKNVLYFSSLLVFLFKKQFSKTVNKQTFRACLVPIFENCS